MRKTSLHLEIECAKRTSTCFIIGFVFPLPSALSSVPDRVFSSDSGSLKDSTLFSKQTGYRSNESPSSESTGEESESGTTNAAPTAVSNSPTTLRITTSEDPRLNREETKIGTTTTEAFAAAKTTATVVSPIDLKVKASGGGESGGDSKRSYPWSS